MKKPNDKKQPNNGGRSLGQLLRSRERMFFESCRPAVSDHTDENGVITRHTYIRQTGGTYRKEDPNAEQAP